MNAILPGNTRIIIDGKQAALHQFKTECGCSLLASLSNAGEK
ncbi:PAAR domain-containing protein [Mixta intestinalis]|nr:PAAR domain-containing protein [Mixta intestinalis]